MNYILYDSDVRNYLLPLTYTRPVADILIGILTIREKWEKRLGCKTSTITQDYLNEKFPQIKSDKNIRIDSCYLPTDSLVEQVKKLDKGQCITYKDKVIAFFTKDDRREVSLSKYTRIPYVGELIQIQYNWDIFFKNGKAIEQDFDLLTKGRKSEILSNTNCVVCAENIFLEQGAIVEFSTLNASNGPIYIGKDAKVMEGSLIRGPFSLGEGGVIKMGCKIYGPTTFGPYSKVGGEVNNSVIFGYSNKAHDGFLGNSVLGQWCNLGAGTSNSNLKNNYAQVKLWNYNLARFVKTGLQFCGLIMGDHSKCSINTMFNTGTVVGVSANIFGSGFPRNFIPSFSWGGYKGFNVYQIDKVNEVVEKVMLRRKLKYTEIDRRILKHIFEQTYKYR